MRAEPAPGSRADGETRKPFYKNVFFLGFVGGIAFLTLLRFVQPSWLSAPEPLAQLPEWSLTDQRGQVVSSQSLRGSVWIGLFCDAPCAQVETLGRLVAPLDDLQRPVPVIAFPSGEAMAAPAGVQVVSGSNDTLRAVARVFAEAFARQPHRGSVSPYATPGSLGVPPMLAVVDQTGAIRGFWPPDELGQGNTINAARMLTRHGPQP